MYDSTDQIVETAVRAARTGQPELLNALDQIPAATYVTDAEGVITYYNKACIPLAGRTPTLGEDRWCVTWKIYTDDGCFLPHDKCPMAEAIYQQIPIRGVTAVAERPDGSRVNFMPFPTPLFAADGTFVGAVNVLVDITDRKQVDFLRTQAARCRRLARGVGDRQTIDTLLRLAREYEAQAERLQPSN